MVDLEDEVKLTNDERETLLHLSAAELYRVYAAIDSQVYRPEQGVLLIKTLLKYGFSYAMLTIVIMIIDSLGIQHHLLKWVVLDYYNLLCIACGILCLL